MERLGNSLFKIGESDSGRKLKVTMKEYLEYALFNRDDSPLYLFESNIEEHEIAKQMVNEYEVPKYLRRDFFCELVSFTLNDNFGNKLFLIWFYFLLARRKEGSTTPMVPNWSKKVRL